MAGAAAPDGEQHVIAAAYHLILALEANNNFSDEFRKLLSDLNTQLSQMVRLNGDEARNLRDIETRLTSAQHTILTVHSTHPKIWDTCPLTAQQYLQAVDEIQHSLSFLETTPLHRGSRGKELFDRAQTILQIAMARLQNELIHILVENKRCFGHAGLPVDLACADSYVSNEDNESISTEAEEDTSTDLIHPDIVPHIKSIADTMFASGYGQEFCQVFTTFWRDTLAEYLTILDVEHLSIEDVVLMEWKYLNSRIRAWRAAIKKIMTVYLASAKRLFHQILGERGGFTLMEVSKTPLLRLLNFGQAMTIVPHRPEHLFCLLDMYEALSSIAPDVDALFPEGSGAFSKVEFHELSNKLGDSTIVIFKQFGNHIALSSSETPDTNGRIPALTRYVTNYVLHVGEYHDTLESLLLQTGNTEDYSEGRQSAVGIHLQSVISNLMSNLDEKSNFYKESPLKHIFMMNNIHYMVHKIRGSKVHPYFGDNWIRDHTVKYRKQEMQYERLTWGSMFALFPEAEKAGKAALKQRCQAFVTAFEEVYKNQTRWCIPDAQLREELRISVSKNLLHAYRNFITVVNKIIGEKYVKYSEQDLALYILDLLEGTPKSLNHQRKR